jgi:acyl-CoA hydrolase
MIESRRAAETCIRMAQMVQPNDANVLGKAFGGVILARIDLCASAAASRFAGHVCVTASFDRVDFHEPIEIGDLVEMEARVTYAGRTSLEVTVEVHTMNLVEGGRRHSNTARVTMVALKEGRPTPVPALVCETREEKAMAILGRWRRQVRKERMIQLQGLEQSLLHDWSDEQVDAAWADEAVFWSLARP